MKVFKKVLNVVITVLMIIVVLISATIAVVAITSGSDGVPSLFGYSLLNVQSGSMEPTFKVGDLIISKEIEENEDLKVGDIVSFYAVVQDQEVIETHRIHEVLDAEGTKRYITKGDANPAPDQGFQVNASILSKYTGKSYEGVGTVWDKLTTPVGFFLVVVLPMIIFFVYETVRVVRNIIAYNRAKMEEEAEKKYGAVGADLSEEDMKKALEQYAKSKEKDKEIKEDTLNTEKDKK